MQYVLIKIQDKMILMSAHEIKALNQYSDGITEQEKPQEDLFPFVVCYGSYMPQPDVSVAKAIEEFEMSKDHFLGFIEDDKCHMIAFHDAKAYEPQQIGHAIRFPFAALIQASEVVLERIANNSSTSVAGFLRYADISPATNILNRPGIIGLKGIERRKKVDDLGLDNWLGAVDQSRAIRAAAMIK